MEETKISVIIPVYNTEKFLHRCIDSVLDQTFKDFQLILVNDGSKDDSLRICKEYEKSDSRVVVIDTPNCGSSSARNTGMEKASGKWIIHYDSDDWVDSDMLRLLYDKAVEEDADIVACGFYMDYDNGDNIQRLYPYDRFEPHSEIFRVEQQYSSVCNKLVKRDLYDKYDIRFVDGVRMWEDLVVTTRLRFHSKKTAIVNRPLYHYYCAQRDSICVADMGKYPHSQIKVIEFLSEYFKSISTSDPIAKKILISLKVTVKTSLIPIDTEDNYNHWKNLYSEADKYILRMKHLPLIQRLRLFMIANLSFRQFYFTRNFYRKLFHIPQESI